MEAILIIACIAAIIVIFYSKNSKAKQLKKENSALVDELHRIKISGETDGIKSEKKEIEEKNIHKDSPDKDHPVPDSMNVASESVQPKKNNGCLIGFTIFFVLGFIIFLYSNVFEDKSKNNSVNTEAALDSAAVEKSIVSTSDIQTEENKVDPMNWEYQENIDQMTDKKTYFAILDMFAMILIQSVLN